MSQLLKDLIFVYTISFPLAITFLVSKIVLSSSGRFSIDMTKYGEFYFEYILFLVWLLLIAVLGGKLLNRIIHIYFLCLK